MAEILRNQNNAEICPRVKEVAVQNVTNQPGSGFHYEPRICSRPLTLNISENRKICPDCEKPAPVGNVKPRTINSNDIGLTRKELEELGYKNGVEPAHKKPAVAKVHKPREAKPAVEAKVSKIKKGVMVIEVSAEELDKASDISSFLIAHAIKAMDNLPAAENFGESKRLIKLQEKLEALLEEVA